MHAEEECPEECKQKEECDRLRQVYFLVRILVAKMGEINPVFLLGTNRHPFIIGSIKEQSRVFFNSEVDVHICLNGVLRSKLRFDRDSQQLKATEKLEKGDHIQRYVDCNGVFDCKKYTLDFIECLKNALTKVNRAMLGAV